MPDVRDRRPASLDPGLAAALERAPADERALVYCATCSTAIARRDDRCEVNGGHAHHFVNPFGIHFDVGCYREALGCAISGQPTAADTWFPGFHWRIATCGECRAHLGWYFERQAGYFYGLILDRIQMD